LHCLREYSHGKEQPFPREQLYKESGQKAAKCRTHRSSSSEEPDRDVSHFSWRKRHREQGNRIRNHEGTPDPTQAAHDRQGYHALHEAGDQVEDHPEYTCNDDSVFVPMDRTDTAAHEYECALGQTVDQDMLDSAYKRHQSRRME
jgi:hypothetical protein